MIEALLYDVFSIAILLAIILAGCILIIPIFSTKRRVEHD